MTSMSGGRFHNRRQQKDSEQRILKRNSTMTSISGGRFHKQRQQKYCEQRRSKTNSTRPTISQARFLNRRQKYRYWTEKKMKGKITPTFIGDKVPKEVMEETTEKSRRKDTKGID